MKETVTFHDIELHEHDVTTDTWTTRTTRVELRVDIDWLATELGRRAHNSRRNKATMGSGHIVARELKRWRNGPPDGAKS